MIQTLEPVLKEHPFLKGLEPSYIKLITECASNVRFDAGEYIFREGEEANDFFIVRHGKVALELFVPGRGIVTVHTIGEGDVLGWSWLVPPYRWFLDARAIQLVRAVALDGKCLRTKCEEDPKLGYELMKRFAHIIMERLQATRLQLLDIYGDRVDAKHK